MRSDAPQEPLLDRVSQEQAYVFYPARASANEWEEHTIIAQSPAVGHLTVHRGWEPTYAPQPPEHHGFFRSEARVGRAKTRRPGQKSPGSGRSRVLDVLGLLITMAPLLLWVSRGRAKWQALLRPFWLAGGCLPSELGGKCRCSTGSSSDWDFLSFFFFFFLFCAYLAVQLLSILQIVSLSGTNLLPRPVLSFAYTASSNLMLWLPQSVTDSTAPILPTSVPRLARNAEDNITSRSLPGRQIARHCGSWLHYWSSVVQFTGGPSRTYHSNSQLSWTHKGTDCARNHGRFRLPAPNLPFHTMSKDKRKIHVLRTRRSCSHASALRTTIMHR